MYNLPTRKFFHGTCTVFVSGSHIYYLSFGHHHFSSGSLSGFLGGLPFFSFAFPNLILYCNRVKVTKKKKKSKSYCPSIQKISRQPLFLAPFISIQFKDCQFSNLQILGNFVKDQLATGLWMYFVLSVSVLLFISVLCCFGYYSCVAYFEDMCCDIPSLFFLFKIALIWVFCGSYKFQECFFYFCEE